MLHIGVRLRGKWGIIGRFFTVYIVFSVLVGLISVITISLNQNFIKNELIHHRQAYLKSTVEMIAGRIREAENIVYQMGSSPGINTFLNRGTLAGTDFYDYKRLWLDIPNYPIINEFIIDIFIHFRNSDVLLSSSKASYRPELFYSTMVRYPNYTFDEWSSSFLYTLSINRYEEVQDVVIDFKKRKAVTLIQSLPLQFPHNPRGTIILVLDAAILTEPLESVAGETGEFFVTDKDGGRLVGSSNTDYFIHADQSAGDIERVIDGTRYLVLTEELEQNGWRCTVVLPRSGVYSGISKVRNITVIIAVFGFIMTAGIGLIIAHHNTLPIRRMLRKVSGFSPFQPEDEPMHAIESTINNLISENTRLSRSLNELDPVIRNRTILRLARGHYESEEKIKNALSARGIEFAPGRYLTAAAVLEGGYGDISEKPSLTKLDMFGVLLRNTIEKILGDRALTCSLEDDTLAVLISVKTHREYRRELESLLGDIQSALAANHGLKVLFTGGSLRDSIMDLYISTAEALSTLENYWSGDRAAVLWYDSLDEEAEDHPGYFYPLDMEHRLDNFIRSGLGEQVQTLFDLIACENFEKRRLSRSDMSVFLLEVLSTIGKTYRSPGLKSKNSCRDIPSIINTLRGKIRGLKTAGDFRRIFDDAVGTAIRLTNVIDGVKLSHNTKLINAVTEYVQAHYREPSLSLTRVADHLHLTEAYLSNFFKEHTGCNYSAYIERLRITSAKEMLRGDLSIDHIALSVGYANKNTFYKAFKRSEGISPGVYRNQPR